MVSGVGLVVTPNQRIAFYLRYGFEQMLDHPLKLFRSALLSRGTVSASVCQTTPSSKAAVRRSHFRGTPVSVNSVERPLLRAHGSDWPDPVSC
jgi:hypothetical protein